MPLAQAAVVPPEDPPFTVVRLLLKPGTWYEDQRERFRPFNRLVRPTRRCATRSWRSRRARWRAAARSTCS